MVSVQHNEHAQNETRLKLSFAISVLVFRILWSVVPRLDLVTSRQATSQASAVSRSQCASSVTQREFCEPDYQEAGRRYLTLYACSRGALGHIRVGNETRVGHPLPQNAI